MSLLKRPPFIPGQRIDFSGDSLAKANRLDKPGDNDVEIVSLAGHGMPPMDPAEATLCATRMWLHRLSFILIVMGSLSLFFVSFFYLLAFIKRKKVLYSFSLPSSRIVNIQVFHFI